MFSSRQVCRFPIHLHSNPCAATGVIVKDEVLQWLRVELAIGAEFQRYLCHPVGLTRGVDSKSVRFTLRDAHHCVEKRRAEKKQCADNQCHKRQSGWIGNSAYAPRVAEASDDYIKEDSRNGEADEHKNTQEG